MTDFIPIGKISKSHALVGAFKLRPYNVNTTFFKYAKKVFIQNGDTFKEFTVEKSNKANESVIIKLLGINTPEEADKLKGLELFVLKSDIPVNNDEILLIDLLGYKAYFNENFIGEISNFSDFGGGNIYVVKTLKDEELLLPDNDNFIDCIDYENKKIIFKNIEDFL